jgi:hypothetical protein
VQLDQIFRRDKEYFRRLCQGKSPLIV